MPKKNTIKHPAVNDQWKRDFSAATFRTNFQLYLSQPMIEFLCATAEGVHWDRSRYPNLHRPDNWIASEKSLTKRGLVRRKCQDDLEAQFAKVRRIEAATGEWTAYEFSCCELTPAGKAIVNLFRVTGIFVEADAAITKKARA